MISLIVCLSLYLSTCEASNKDFIVVPVSTSPVVHLWLLPEFPNALYESKKQIYSRVTVNDVAKAIGKNLTETIKKSVKTLFRMAVAAQVSETLKIEQMSESKWSYRIPVSKLLESNQSINNLTENTEIFKIQEMAMKVLSKKYGFNTNFILKKLCLSLMDFYAADEEQWIKIVGIITKIVIRNMTNKLNLTPCYLAELIGKTEKEMEAFTLNDIDKYLNSTKLIKNLSLYKENTMHNFYEEVQITPIQIAELSNKSVTEIKNLGVKDSIEHFTKTVLGSLNLSKEHLKRFENKTVCPHQWESYKKLMIIRAFNNKAKEMSILPKSLAKAMRISYRSIRQLPLLEMIQLINGTINQLQQNKQKIEKLTLSMLKEIYSDNVLNIKKHNSLSIIKQVTHLRKRQLRFFYGWKKNDHNFERLFTVKDLGNECSFDVNKKTLSSLAKLNVGERSKKINCTKFYVLKMVWNQASLDDLAKLYSPKKTIAIDEPLASVMANLTNSSLHLNTRVLSRDPITQWLLEKLTLTNISHLTSYTLINLQEIPITRIAFLISQLIINGSLDQLLEVFTLFEKNFVRDLRYILKYHSDSLTLTLKYKCDKELQLINGKVLPLEGKIYTKIFP